MKDKIIPVVYSVNNNYAPYLYVSLQSLIDNIDMQHEYRIYILYTDLEKRHRKHFKQLKDHNIQIECVDVSKNMRGIVIEDNNYLTVETCYRLLLPEIFQKYERILYIDTDTLIMADIAELFESKLNGKAVGAIHEAVSIYLKKYYQSLGVGEAFNAGVLVIDMELFRKMNIGSRCLALLMEDCKKEKRNLQYMDQDALNIVLKGNVCFLDSTWNFLYRYLQDIDLLHEEQREGYLERVNNIKIIHYVSEMKPWEYPEYKLADLFWKVAGRTPYYEEILFKNFGKKEDIKSNLFKEFCFPFSKIPRNSRIALYGAGNVGTKMEEQNRLMNYAKIVIWVDKNYRKIRTNSKKIYEIRRLWEQEELYDYVLIAIDDSEICKAVEQELLENGVQPQKIIWGNYRRNAIKEI